MMAAFPTILFDFDGDIFVWVIGYFVFQEMIEIWCNIIPPRKQGIESSSLGTSRISKGTSHSNRFASG